MSPAERDRQFNVRLSEAEIEDVRSAADRYGLSASDFVRYAIAIQVQVARGVNAKVAKAEGMMRKADLARWDAERAAKAAGVKLPKR